ncbi:hypothetical protein [Streptomyces xanthochromogenes]|uniref:hypothetical protein n=1 Tax=Streptomyces xanthochromogenes TaxID=67384 RepID=UPI0034256C9F
MAQFMSNRFLDHVKAPTTEPHKKSPWLETAEHPERVTLTGLFASGHWMRSILGEDLLVVARAIA